jgi:Putative transposase
MIRKVAHNPAHLGAEIGFFSVLHTWNQKLQLHPHVTVSFAPADSPPITPAGFDPIHASSFPLLYCAPFRGKFVAGLKSAFQRGQLHLPGELAPLAHPKSFAAWLRPLFRKELHSRERLPSAQ